MWKSFFTVAAVFTAASLLGVEAEKVILTDDFSNEKATLENWKLQGGGRKYEADKKQVHCCLMTLKKVLPPNVKVSMKFAVTGKPEADKHNNARGGFIGGLSKSSFLLTVTPHGTVGIGRNGKKIEGYEINKPMELVAQRRAVDNGEKYEFTFWINGKEMLKSTTPKKNVDLTAPLVISGHGFVPVVSDVKIVEIQ